MFEPVVQEGNIKSKPSCDFVSFFYQYVDLELKSPRIKQSKLLEFEILTLTCIKWVPWNQSNILLATIFAQTMPDCSGSMYSSILMLQNIWHHHFSWSGSNSQDIVNLLQFSSGPEDPQLKQNSQFLVNSVHFRQNNDVICFFNMK